MLPCEMWSHDFLSRVPVTTSGALVMFVSFPTLSQEISGVVMGKTEAANSRAQDSQLM